MKVLLAGGSAQQHSTRPEDDDVDMHEYESDTYLPQMADCDPEPVQHLHAAAKEDWKPRKAPVLDESNA